MSLTSIMVALLAAAQPAPAEDNILVLRARFYVYARDASRVAGPMRETTLVPHRPETSCYSWYLDVSPQQRSVTIRELFVLPAPARRWGLSDPSQTSIVARDRASAATQFEATLTQGLIAHGWCVLAGDPVGPHRIRVYHGDRLLYEFKFTVVPDLH